MQSPHDLPKLSAVSVFHNRRQLATASIQSLLDQTYPNLEILIVDDGSTDGTGDLLESFNDPRLQVWRKENSGFTDSVDQAVRRTSGDYVAIHGAGDISLTERFSRQVSLLNDNPDVGVVGCWRHAIDVDGSFLKEYRPSEEPDFHAAILERNRFVHGDAMFRRELFDRIGGYRRVFKFAQDRDLWVRMSRHTSYRIVPEVLYHQVWTPESIRQSPDKRMLQGFLSSFAVQNARHFDKTGVDLVDQYGELSLFFRKPDRQLATQLGERGMGLMRDGELEMGWLLLSAAMRERPSLMNTARYLAAATHKNAFVWNKVVTPLLSARSKLIEITGSGRNKDVPLPTQRQRQRSAQLQERRP